MIDDTEEHGISNPFTTKLSPELQALKEQQVHSLAPRSSKSRILRKAEKKMVKETQKKVEKSVGFPCLCLTVKAKEGYSSGAWGKTHEYMGQAAVSATHKAGCEVLMVVESRVLIWFSHPALTKLLCHHQGQLKAGDASMKDSVNGHPTHRPRAASWNTAPEEREPLVASSEKNLCLLQEEGSVAEWEFEESPPTPG